MNRCLAAIVAIAILLSGSGLQQAVYAEEKSESSSSNIEDAEAIYTEPGEAAKEPAEDTVHEGEESNEEEKKDVVVPPVVENKVDKPDTEPAPFAATGGLLSIGVIGGTLAADKTTEFEVLYKPAVDGNNKYMEITGIAQSGLQLVTAPVKDDKNITEVVVEDDLIRIKFSDLLTSTNSISFRFQVKMSNEKTFVDNLDQTTDHLTGILLKEYVGGAIHQTTATDSEISYTMQNGDIYHDLNTGHHWLSGSISNAMVLKVSAQDVDALDGTGWINKEAKYSLSSGQYEGKISDRYIKDLQIEMPLPNNVTFISSDYETERDGIKIAYDVGRNYLILTCDSYTSSKRLDFTMTLNFKGLNNVSGINSGRGQYYGVDEWHNFFSSSRVPGRAESGRPWILTGKMYGKKQRAEFYDRSKLYLNSLPDVKAYNFISTYEYSKPQTNVNIGTNQIGEEGGYRIIENGISFGKHDFTKRVHFRMDPAIRVKAIHFDPAYNTNISNILDRIKVTFTTKKGLIHTYGRAEIESSNQLMKAPECEKGDYIEKITIASPAEEKGRQAFVSLKADILDTDLNGNKLPVDTRSYIYRSNDITEYGSIGGQTAGGARYKATNPAEPNVDLRASGGVSHTDSSDYFKSTRYLIGRDYTDVGLISVSNDGEETSTKEKQDLTNVKVRTGSAIYTSTSITPSYIYPIFQLAGKSAATLLLTGYKNTESLPDITLIGYTAKGDQKKILVPASALQESDKGYKAVVNWGIPEDDILVSFQIEVSSLPIDSKVTLTADNIDMRNHILPDGTDIREKSGESEKSWGGRYNNWSFPSVRAAYKNSSGESFSSTNSEKEGAMIISNTGLVFSNIVFAETEPLKRPTTIVQGEKTTVQFQLQDIAFNPVYAFEVDKHFNYMAGSFQNGAGNQFKFIEEWIPNYFKNTGDPNRDGNGLLRIRFVGTKSQAFNLYPVVNSNDNVSKNTPFKFKMSFQAKIEADPGSYCLVPKLYRSDQWAIKELKRSKVDVKNCAELWNHPDTAGRNPVEVSGDYYQNYGAKITSPDTYDIDGDGKTDTQVCTVDTLRLSTENRMLQKVTKVGKTKVDGYLVDPDNGNEIRDAKLYPHQEFDFIQLMEIIDSNNYTDFVGYYHIPKTNHKIAYIDPETSVESTYISKFDTYLKDFITTTVDGTDITDSGKIQVYYFVSDDPTDLTDGHNIMNELNDDGIQDDVAHYKTKEQIIGMVTADRTLDDILSNVTMIKIKADEIEAAKLIKSKTRLAVGHKGGDIGEIQDYFSGAYRYVTPGGAKIPTQYTPLMTFTLLDYDIKGTLWKDKDANSLLSPKEDRIKGMEIELWNTGVGGHEETPREAFIEEKTTTDENGAFAFKQSYHGNYYLQFEIPDNMLLSLPNQAGGLPYEQSVFEKVTDPKTNKVYGRVYFSLIDNSFLYQNAGFVDKRSLSAPTDVYISEGETLELNYKITPDYLMKEEYYKISPTLVSDVANDTYFTADEIKITGVAAGEGKITLSIPAAPLDGSTYLTQDVNIHVEPASVASVSVPAKAEIYAIQGKQNDVIAPELTIYNYDKDPVKTYIKQIALTNTGNAKTLKLVEKSDSYAENEISLNVIPVKRNNKFSALKKTDITKVAYIKGGLLLGTMESFTENQNFGTFTFDGEYSPDIVNTDLEDNRFAMTYRFEK